MDVKLYKSLWLTIRGLILGFFLGILGVYYYNDPITPKWFIWLSLSLSMVCLIKYGYDFFDRRPQIIINETGIFDRTIFKEFINWKIIQDAYIGEFGGSYKQKFICLVIDEKVDITGMIKANRLKAYQKMGFQKLNIDLGMININEVKFNEFIVKMTKADKDLRRELIEKVNLTL